MNQNRCVHCIVSGKVQGVFYRANTQKRALQLGLTGWVRNCKNGDVELIAQGESDALEQLIAWLYEGPPMAKVIEVAIEEKEHDPNFTDFIIEK